jgi:hypothetical protein
VEQHAEGGESARGASAVGSVRETRNPNSDHMQSCRLAPVWRPRGRHSMHFGVLL